MNRGLELVYDNFPNVKKRMEDPSSVVFESEEEIIFYQLALFISEPQNKKKTILNLTDAHNALERDKLRLYLDVVDYCLVPSGKLENHYKGFDATEYVKQRTFYDMLVQAIPNTTLNSSHFWRSVKQGKIVPSPDLVIDGQNFWLKSTVKQFIQEEKKDGKRIRKTL